MRVYTLTVASILIVLQLRYGNVVVFGVVRVIFVDRVFRLQNTYLLTRNRKIYTYSQAFSAQNKPITAMRTYTLADTR